MIVNDLNVYVGFARIVNNIYGNRKNTEKLSLINSLGTIILKTLQTPGMKTINSGPAVSSAFNMTAWLCQR